MIKLLHTGCLLTALVVQLEQSVWYVCVGSDDVGGPEEDLTGVMVDEDTAALELEMALNKARRLNQTKRVRRQNERDVAMAATADDDDAPTQYRSSIELNSTSEFCRSLGEIPTLGLAGNRDDDDDEMSVCTVCLFLNTWYGDVGGNTIEY